MNNQSSAQKQSLTPQELEVFLHCRRIYLMKGAVFAVAYCANIYWFRAQNRGFSFIHKYPRLTYIVGSAIAFVVGVQGVQHCITQRLLALDNSPLADIIRKKRASRSQDQQGIIHPPQAGEKPPQQPLFKKDPVQHYSQSRPPVQPRSPELKDGPSINSHSYNRDRSMLDTSPKELEEKNQPDAFGSADGNSAFPNNQPESMESSQGRTFDEIREEKRRQRWQSQSNSPTTDQPSSNIPAGKPGSTKRKRYNKYGDEIED